MKRTNQLGFGVGASVLIIIIVAVAGAIGYNVWHNQQSNKDNQTQNAQQTSNKKETVSDSGSKKAAIIATWKEFNDPTVGLVFHYPDGWGTAQLQVMNSRPSDPNFKFYKISFEKNTAYITINPKESIQEFNVTFDNLKDSIKDYPESRYVLDNDHELVITLQPDAGNQQAAIYAAKLISLPKIDANYILLNDAKDYGTPRSCSPESYINCYSIEEQNEIQWLLESAKTI